MSTLQNITVLGGGVLGSQIAWHSAFKGKQVVVYDINSEAVGRCQTAHDQYAFIYQQDVGATAEEVAATRSRLRFSTDLADAVAQADLVIEAVPEVPEIKSELYASMAPLLPQHTLIATNSSTFLPRDFAAATGRPDKYCALHYANLIWTMNLAEIMRHEGTAESTLTAVTEFAIETGMVPIPLQKEQNGYVLNSWFVPLLNAAQTLITNGVSTPEVIDRSYMIANRGCALGPVGMIDIVGMKTAFDITSYWGEVNGDEQMLKNAEYLKTQFLDQGKLGMQTGAGYYQYPDPAYTQPDFLAVPSKAEVANIVASIGC